MEGGIQRWRNDISMSVKGQGGKGDKKVRREERDKERQEDQWMMERKGEVKQRGSVRGSELSVSPPVFTGYICSLQ